MIPRSNVMMTSVWMEEYDMAQSKEPLAEESIGQKVARLRRERGLTQQELAEQLGLTQTVVSDYENDVLKFNGPLLIKLAHIFHVSADQLLGLKKIKGNGQTLRPGVFRRLKQIEKLKKRDQQALLRTIDGFLSGKVAQQ